MENIARQQLGPRIRSYADTFVKIISEFEEKKLARA
jgi:hypothetical protein